MNQLPQENFICTTELARVFRNTSSTYKFYWFLAILELVEKGHQQIKKESLFIKMLTIPWYTVNYFHISFGSQDLIQQNIKEIIKLNGISITAKKADVEIFLKTNQNQATKNLISHFDKNVPHWFLSPWYGSSTKNNIYELSQGFTNDVMYALKDDHIVINPLWFTYLQKHSKVLRDYCYWNLALFLQARNPNVPDIPNKLIKPGKRNSLNKQRSKYWDEYFNAKKQIICIFTGATLTKENYALDHFIPYAFVSHDLIWNLIPIDYRFNSRKSDRLPNLDKHFEKFFALQKDAFWTLENTFNIKKFKEEYYTIFPILNNESDFEKEKFRNVISPLITIAENNGFQHFGI